MKTYLFLIAGLGVILLAALIAVVVIVRRLNREAVKPSDVAGRRGEEKALEQIVHILKPEDVLLTNVQLDYDGKRTELDNVVINPNGVFIVEVKNYSGKLKGRLNDFEWTKVHVSSAGKSYVKRVKNPIRQVRRQIYILARFLESKGAGGYIQGCAWLLDAKSPVKSHAVVHSADEVDALLHTKGKQTLDLRTQRLIAHWLKGN